MPAATFAPAWLDTSPEKLGGCVQSPPPPPFNSYYITNSYYIDDKNNDKEDEINIYNVNNLGENSGNNNDEN